MNNENRKNLGQKANDAQAHLLHRSGGRVWVDQFPGDIYGRCRGGLCQGRRRRWLWFILDCELELKPTLWWAGLARRLIIETMERGHVVASRSPPWRIAASRPRCANGCCVCRLLPSGFSSLSTPSRCPLGFIQLRRGCLVNQSKGESGLGMLGRPAGYVRAHRGDNNRTLLTPLCFLCRSPFFRVSIWQEALYVFLRFLLNAFFDLIAKIWDQTQQVASLPSKKRKHHAAPHG